MRDDNEHLNQSRKPARYFYTIFFHDESYVCTQQCSIDVKLHICKFVVMSCTEYAIASGSIRVSCFKNITYFQRATYTDIGHPKHRELNGHIHVLIHGSIFYNLA